MATSEAVPARWFQWRTLAVTAGAAAATLALLLCACCGGLDGALPALARRGSTSAGRDCFARHPRCPYSSQVFANGFFDGAAPTYTYPNSYCLGAMSSWAYAAENMTRAEWEAAFTAAFTFMGLEEGSFAFFYSRPDLTVETAAVVASSPTDTFVAFRGTDSRRDVFTDINGACVPSDVIGGDLAYCVHKGFSEGWASVEDRVAAAVAEQLVIPGTNSTRKLIITGHSLGGALAVLAAGALQNRGYSVTQVYTYGQPRVGNITFVHRYAHLGLNTTTYRVQEPLDPVPLLGPMAWGYRHAGQAHARLDKKCILADSAPDAGCMVHPPGFPDRCAIVVADHYLDVYLRSIEQCALQTRAAPKCAFAQIPLPPSAPPAAARVAAS